MQTFEVRNSNQIIRFDGVLLAAVTSARPHAPRYTVLELYGLGGVSPSHVLHRVGHSLVFHTSDCPQAIRTKLPYGHEIDQVDMPLLDQLFPCQFCAPSLRNPHPMAPDFLTIHKFEVPRHYAAVISDAHALVTMLTTPDAPMAGWLSTQLLNVAATKDRMLAEAFAIDLTRHPASVMP
jgi:hypothetical protein